MRTATFAFAVLLASTPLSARATTSSDTVSTIAGQFDTHSVIQLGELHRSLQIHSFIQQMLHDPRFVCRADDVVVEFGNSRLQKLADLYATGGNLTEAQIASMYRETLVPLTWNAPVYRAVYDAVRD